MTSGLRPKWRHPVVGQLAALRIIAGLTQAQIAIRLSERLGVDVTVEAVRTWEAGTRSPRLPHLDAYAEILGHELLIAPIELPDDETGDLA